ncbi:MAG TPA: T9SS type A sorting domain-containing protein [Bacteroidia bacterium]|nr:T9SS type A sorting domain-containing protein [Bacteroidia bacterium]
MKKPGFIFILFLCAGIKAQITLENTYPVSINPSVVKLQQAGYKYVFVDMPNAQIRLYNPNHSLYKTITVPSISANSKQVFALSDQLFNSNGLIEYGLATVYQSSNPPSMSYTFFVFDENGQQLFKRDSASVLQTMTGENALLNPDPLYSVGSGTKLKLCIAPGGNQYFEVYSLPGTIPCEPCGSNGGNPGAVGVGDNSGGTNAEKARFFPNPVTEQLKLKYNLPRGSHEAIVKIYSTEGKLIEQMKLSHDFDYILLPSDYNNGLYFYSLEIDGKVIQTEKVVLSR